MKISSSPSTSTRDFYVSELESIHLEIKERYENLKGWEERLEDRERLLTMAYAELETTLQEFKTRNHEEKIKENTDQEMFRLRAHIESLEKALKSREDELVGLASEFENFIEQKKVSEKENQAKVQELERNLFSAEQQLQTERVNSESQLQSRLTSIVMREKSLAERQKELDKSSHNLRLREKSVIQRQSSLGDRERTIRAEQEKYTNLLKELEKEQERLGQREKSLAIRAKALTAKEIALKQKDNITCSMEESDKSIIVKQDQPKSTHQWYVKENRRLHGQIRELCQRLKVQVKVKEDEEEKQQQLVKEVKSIRIQTDPNKDDNNHLIITHLCQISEFLMNDNWPNYFTHKGRKDGDELLIFENFGKQQKRINDLLNHYEEAFLWLHKGNNDQEALVSNPGKENESERSKSLSLAWLEFGLFLASRSSVPLSGKFLSFIEVFLGISATLKSTSSTSSSEFVRQPFSQNLKFLLDNHPISTIFLMLLIPLSSLLPSTWGYEEYGKMLDELVETCRSDSCAIMLMGSWLVNDDNDNVNDCNDKDSHVVRVIRERAKNAGILCYEKESLYKWKTLETLEFLVHHQQQSTRDE